MKYILSEADRELVLMKKSVLTPKIVAITASVILFSLITFVGCSSYPKKTQVAPIEEVEELQYEQKPDVKPVVQLSPGDILDIRFFYTPELNTVQAIRPDGKIALQLVGEVVAQGKTPEALREELYSVYSQHISQLDVTVIIQEYSNRRVYVGGQVLAPGSVPLPGQMTVFEALMLAGGVNLEAARYDNVVVIRHVNGKWIGGKLDLGEVMAGGESSSYNLQALDIVYVPETHIYEVNRWVEQHISRIMPEVGISWTFADGQLLGTGVGVTLNPSESTR
jgi:protein involved in polysaccharide export with SLBB domain